MRKRINAGLSFAKVGIVIVIIGAFLLILPYVLPDQSPEPLSEIETQTADTTHPTGVPDKTTPTEEPFSNPTETAEPTISPILTPPYLENLTKLNCTQIDAYSKCVDETLDIEFEYPSSWGEIEYNLRPGGYTGFAYDYIFDGKTIGEAEPLLAGGRSKDFAEGRGGMPTDFSGFTSSETRCEEVSDSYSICQEINPDLIWMIWFPDAEHFCNHISEDIIDEARWQPVARIEVNLPRNPSIHGFVFEVPFLSDQLIKQFNDELLPLIGLGSDAGYRKCTPSNRQMFDNQVQAYIELVKANQLDEATLENLNEIMHLANSIQIHEVDEVTNTIQPIGISNEINIEKVGQIGGGAGPVVLVGDYAYLATGDHLTIDDISDPEKPLAMGICESLSIGSINAMMVDGGFLYITSDHGLLVLGLSDPDKPRLIGTLETPGIHPGDLAIAGQYAYATAGEAGLLVIGIHDPESPELVSIFDTPTRAYAVDISGDYAYLSEEDIWPEMPGGLRVVDISNPTSPSLVAYDGRLSTSVFFYTYDVKLDNGYAYIVGYDDPSGMYGLRILDISDPTNPQQVGENLFSAYSAFNELSVAGDIVWVNSRYCQLRDCDYDDYGVFIDVSDPANPVQVEEIDLEDLSSSELAGNFLIHNGYAVQTSHTGLEIWDPGSPDHERISRIELPVGMVEDVTVSGQYAYLIDSVDKIAMIDVSDPDRPFLSGGLTIPDHNPDDDHGTIITSLAVDGDYVYAVLAGQGLAVVDVDNPLESREIAFLPLDGLPGSVFVRDGFAYVSGSYGVDTGNVAIVDISDPTTPKLMGIVPRNGHYEISDNQFWEGRYHNVARVCPPDDICSKELHILNGIGMGDESTVLGKLPLGNEIVCCIDSEVLFVINGYAYISKNLNYVDPTKETIAWMIVDVSDPRKPSLVEEYELPIITDYWPGSTVRLDREANYVLLQQYVVNLSDPLAPRFIAQSPYLDGPRVAEGGYIYVAGGDAGLLILDYSE